MRCIRAGRSLQGALVLSAVIRGACGADFGGAPAMEVLRVSTPASRRTYRRAASPHGVSPSVDRSGPPKRHDANQPVKVSATPSRLPVKRNRRFRLSFRW
jgi:hypothetical protein